MKTLHFIPDMMQETKTPLDNDAFYHAEDTFKLLQMITKEIYCPSCTSWAINTLECYYKGFLIAATEFDSHYQVSDEKLLHGTHNLWRLYTEIRRNYPNCFPWLSQRKYAELRQTMFRWKDLYSSARYEEYPDYQVFRQVMDFTAAQRDILFSYIKETNFEQDYRLDWTRD